MYCQIAGRLLVFAVITALVVPLVMVERVTLSAAGTPVIEAAGEVRAQAGDDIPSDLPADNGGRNQVEPIDDPLDAEVDQAETGDDPLDAGAEDEPLDDTAAAPDPTPEPDAVADAPAPTTSTAAPTETTVAHGPVLPADFGRGQTVVLNPPAGTTVTAPTDCKYLVENGRAVVGIGCGDDDGPFWLDQVGALGPPAARGNAVAPPSTTLGGSSAVVVAGSPRPADPRDAPVLATIVTENGQRTLRFPDLNANADPDPTPSGTRRGERPRLSGNLNRATTLNQRLKVFQSRQGQAADRAAVRQPARVTTESSARRSQPERTLSAARARSTTSAPANGAPKACARLAERRAAGNQRAAQLDQLKQRCKTARQERN